MSETVFTRLRRVVSGQIEDGVDALERAGGQTIMRESIREMERTVDAIRANRDEAAVQRLQAAKQMEQFAAKIEGLDEKARFALEQGRADIAEAVVSRQIDFEAIMEELRVTEARASERETALEREAETFAARADAMREQLDAFETAKAQTGAGERETLQTAQARGRDADRAEAAFGRAMGGAGGVVVDTMGDAGTRRSLAELEQLSRQDAIARRLDALRDRTDAA